MKNLLAIIATLSCLLGGGGMERAYGQIFASRQVERLALQTQIDLPASDGVHYHALLFKGLPLTVVVEHGVVCHIGHSLFTPLQRQFIDEAHCNFLERISLAADIPNFYGIDFRQYMRDEKVEVLDGRLENLKSIIADTTYIFQCTEVNGRGVVACWKSPVDNANYLTLAYPANFHLINGLSMIEAEDGLFDRIRLTQMAMTEQYEPESSLLQPVGDGALFLMKGDSFYLPELNSNRYYVKDEKQHFSPLCSESYPAESLANLFTGVEIDNEILLSVRFVKYGHHVDEFKVPLQKWLAFCLQSGCNPYFGVVGQEENRITCESIMQNKSLGYCHVMKITADPMVLKNRRGEIQARLNSYVPMSNLKSLFNDEEKE